MTVEIPEEYKKLEVFYKEFRVYKRKLFGNMTLNAKLVNKKTEMEKHKQNINNKLNKNLHDPKKFLEEFFVDVCQINKLYYRKNPTITNPFHRKMVKNLSEFLQNLIKNTKS